MQVYRFIYYRLYSWNLKAWGAGDFPQYNACLWLALVSVVNVFSIALVLGVDLGAPGRYLAVSLFVISAVAHYWYFIHTGRYGTLSTEFSQPLFSSVLIRMVPWAYGAGSPALFLLLLAVLGPIGGYRW